MQRTNKIAEYHYCTVAININTKQRHEQTVIYIKLEKRCMKMKQNQKIEKRITIGKTKKNF